MEPLRDAYQAKAPDRAHGAYRVIGDGPVDVVRQMDWPGSIDLEWEDPLGALFYREVASLSHVILHDRRGKVLIPQTVKDLVAGSGLSFEDAGEHGSKGGPDRWHIHRVVSP